MFPFSILSKYAPLKIKAINDCNIMQHILTFYSWIVSLIFFRRANEYAVMNWQKKSVRFVCLRLGVIGPPKYPTLILETTLPSNGSRKTSCVLRIRGFAERAQKLMQDTFHGGGICCGETTQIHLLTNFDTFYIKKKQFLYHK